MVRWFGWLGVGACATDPAVPRFAQTAQRCGFETVVLDGAALASDAAVYPSEACVDAVLVDFSVDVDVLLAADGLQDPYGVVYGEPSGHTRVGTLLGAAWVLHTVDFGVLGDVAEEPALVEALRAVSAVSGSRALAPLLYDYVVQRIEVVTVGDTGSADAGMTWNGRMLWNLVGTDGLSASALLVHEARHRDGFVHVDCGDGSEVCDRGYDGAVGFQLAVHERGLAVAADPSVVDLELRRIDWLVDRLR